MHRWLIFLGLTVLSSGARPSGEQVEDAVASHEVANVSAAAGTVSNQVTEGAQKGALSVIASGHVRDQRGIWGRRRKEHAEEDEHTDTSRSEVDHDSRADESAEGERRRKSWFSSPFRRRKNQEKEVAELSEEEQDERDEDYYMHEDREESVIEDEQGERRRKFGWFRRRKAAQREEEDRHEADEEDGDGDGDVDGGERRRKWSLNPFRRRKNAEDAQEEDDEDGDGDGAGGSRRRKWFRNPFAKKVEDVEDDGDDEENGTIGEKVKPGEDIEDGSDEDNEDEDDGKEKEYDEVVDGKTQKRKMTFWQHVKCFFARKCPGPEPPLKTFVAKDAEEVFHGTKGLAYRTTNKYSDKKNHTPDYRFKDQHKMLKWGDAVRGLADKENHWVKVNISDPYTGSTPQIRYLPTDITGHVVLEEDDDANLWKPPPKLVDEEEEDDEIVEDEEPDPNVTDTDDGNVSSGDDPNITDEDEDPDTEPEVPIPEPIPVGPTLDDFIGKEKADETNTKWPGPVEHFTGYDEAHNKRFGLHDKSKFIHEHALGLAEAAGKNYKAIVNVHDHQNKFIAELQNVQKQADDARIDSGKESRIVRDMSVDAFKKLADFHKDRGTVEEHFDVPNLQEKFLLDAGKEEKEKNRFDFWAPKVHLPSQWPNAKLDPLEKPSNHYLFSYMKPELKMTELIGDVEAVDQHGNPLTASGEEGGGDGLGLGGDEDGDGLDEDGDEDD